MRCSAVSSNKHKRRLALRYLALGILVAVALPGCSSLHLAPLNPISAVPPQGVYESCPPHDGSICLDRLKQIAHAGFQLVLNYDQFYGTASQELTYAATAHALNLKIIWGMSDPAFRNGANLPRYYSELGATCQCSDNAGFIHYVVGLVRNLPATWGYYIGDEVKATERSSVEAFTTLVHSLDPSHPRLYIATENLTTLGSNLEPFADTAEVVGADYYPIGTDASPDTTAAIAQTVQFVANRHRRQSAFVLQAFNWGQYPTETWVCSPFPRCARYPTEDEMRTMRDLVLRYAHPALLLWYSYFDTVRSENSSRHWSDLVAAAGVHGQPTHEKLPPCRLPILIHSPALRLTCGVLADRRERAYLMQAPGDRIRAPTRWQSLSLPL